LPPDGFSAAEPLFPILDASPALLPVPIDPPSPIKFLELSGERFSLLPPLAPGRGKLCPPPLPCKVGDFFGKKIEIGVSSFQYFLILCH